MYQLSDEYLLVTYEEGDWKIVKTEEVIEEYNLKHSWSEYFYIWVYFTDDFLLFEKI